MTTDRTSTGKPELAELPALKAKFVLDAQKQSRQPFTGDPATTSDDDDADDDADENAEVYSEKHRLSYIVRVCLSFICRAARTTLTQALTHSLRGGGLCARRP